jgi:hypothetical protein
VTSIEDDLERVEAELASTETDLARLGARAEGLRAERDALSRAIASLKPDDDRSEQTTISAKDIGQMVRNDAIVAVLRNAQPQALRAAEISEALGRAGRPNDPVATVSVYLDGLLKQRRVLRVARGLYTALDAGGSA